MRYVLLALENLSPKVYGIIDTHAPFAGDSRYYKFGEDRSTVYGVRDIFLIEDQQIVTDKIEQLNAA